MPVVMMYETTPAEWLNHAPNSSDTAIMVGQSHI